MAEGETTKHKTDKKFWLKTVSFWYKTFTTYILTLPKQNTNKQTNQLSNISNPSSTCKVSTTTTTATAAFHNTLALSSFN